MKIKRIAAFAAMSLFSGCAIHPVPEDVTGVDTLDIVKQIRCETRNAAISLLLDFLDDQGKDYPNSPGNPLARKLAKKYEQDPNSISPFLPDLFKGAPKTQSVINVLYSVGTAYSFALTMTEDNDFVADADFLQMFTRSMFKLKLGTGLRRKRSNNRIFTVTDTFRGLLTELNTNKKAGRRYCDGHIVRANHIYPIAGRIGVDKLARDFIRLTIFGNLGASAKEAKPGVGGPPTMADELTFTTTINASATPRIEFTPGDHVFELLNAQLTADVKRMDMHQVTVALAIAPSGVVALDPLRAYLFSPQRGAAIARGPTAGRRRPPITAMVVGRRVIGGGTPSEALAVLAIDQLKSRELQLIPSP